MSRFSEVFFITTILETSTNFPGENLFQSLFPSDAAGLRIMFYWKKVFATGVSLANFL